MSTPLSLSVEREWNALNFLSTWVAKNIRNLFSNQKYCRAQGFLSDDLVVLEGVKLGTIEGSMSDGFVPLSGMLP